MKKVARGMTVATLVSKTRRRLEKSLARTKKRLSKKLSRITRRLVENPRPSIDDLDTKLEKYLGYRGGFFIEAGAHDGYSQSNTYFLEKRRGWRGILVEGIPELYEKCKRKRRRSAVHHCALVAADCQDVAVTMHFAGLMSVVDGALKTEERQKRHVAKGMDLQHLSESYSIRVPARTLESILDATHSVPAIDFLSLDVEGYELDVLKGLNLSRYRPKYVLVEARFFDEVNAFLEEHGYDRIEKFSPYDYLYRAREGGRAQ